MAVEEEIAEYIRFFLGAYECVRARQPRMNVDLHRVVCQYSCAYKSGLIRKVN